MVAPDAIDGLVRRASGGASAEQFSANDLRLVNAALSSDYGRAAIDADYPVALAARLAHVESIIASIPSDQARQFLSSDAMKVWLIDYHNQFGLEFDKPLHLFLKGEEVTIANGRRTLQVQGELDLGDVLAFYFSTKYAVDGKAGDLARRFNNIVGVVESFGLSWPAATDGQGQALAPSSSALTAATVEIGVAEDGAAMTGSLVLPGDGDTPTRLLRYPTDGAEMEGFAVAGGDGELALALPEEAVRGTRATDQGIEILLVTEAGGDGGVLCVDAGGTTLEARGRATALLAPGTRLEEWSATDRGWTAEGRDAGGAPLRVAWERDAESGAGVATIDTIVDGLAATRTVAVPADGVATERVSVQDGLALLTGFLAAELPGRLDAVSADPVTAREARTEALQDAEDAMRAEAVTVAWFEPERPVVAVTWEGDDVPTSVPDPSTTPDSAITEFAGWAGAGDVTAGQAWFVTVPGSYDPAPAGIESEAYDAVYASAPFTSWTDSSWTAWSAPTTPAYDPYDDPNRAPTYVDPVDDTDRVGTDSLFASWYSDLYASAWSDYTWWSTPVYDATASWSSALYDFTASWSAPAYDYTASYAYTPAYDYTASYSYTPSYDYTAAYSYTPSYDYGYTSTPSYDYTSSYSSSSYGFSFGYGYGFYDPVVLDLDGDGVELVGLWDSTVFFDVDADGFRERTGWVGGDDGMLVRDTDGNGAIDTFAEVFSETYGGGAPTGMSALQALDANGDHVLDAQDPGYGEIRVWRDVDGDGRSDTDELALLPALGVAAVDLAATETDRLRDGNVLVSRGTFVRDDGTAGAMSEVALLVGVNGLTWDAGLVSAGFDRVTAEDGRVYAVALDGAPHTLDVATAGAQAATGGLGADTLLSSGTGPVMLVGGGGDDVLTGGAGADVVSGGAGADRVNGGDGDDTLSGGPGADTLDGGAGTDTLSYRAASGGVAIDLASGTAAGADADGDVLLAIERVEGSAFDDVLTGDAGPNRLAGSAGRDTLRGAGGNDTYVFERGDGADRVLDEDRRRSAYAVDVPYEVVTVEYVYSGGEYGSWTEVQTVSTAWRSEARYRDDVFDGGVDVLAFGSGITAADLVARIDGSDLVVGVRAGGAAPMDALVDRVVFQDWMRGESRVESFTFTDGTVLDVAGIASLLGTDDADAISWSETAVTITAGAGDDTVTAGAGDDRIDGGAGRDVLDGGAGADVLAGGAGADVLRGGAGNDVLVVDADDVAADVQGGDGIDAITTADERGVAFDLGGSRLEVAYGGDGADRFTTSARAPIYAEGGGGADVLRGGVAADHLDGGDGDDTLEGGPGADSLLGGLGIDTVSYESSGAGVDVSLATGTATGGHAEHDVLTEVEGVIGSAYADRLEGDGLGNRLAGGAGDDTLTGGGAGDVLDGGAGTDTASYAESGAGVTVRLAAGTGAGGDAEGDTVLDVEQVTGSAFDDVLEGGPGANVLAGAAGNDVLAGGGGADRLDGGEGRDTVSYARSPAGVVIDLATGVAEGGDAGGDGLVDVEDVEGSAFADALTGTAGPNVLAGGGGDDVLSGGGGDDVYRMARGGGWDTVRDERRVAVAETVTVAREETYTEVVWWSGGENSYYTEEVRTRTVYDTATRWREEVQDGGRDTLAFAAGIGPEALWVHREGADLVVAVAAPGAEGEPGAAVDGVRLRDWDTAATRVERLAFDDGAVIDLAALDGALGTTPLHLAASGTDTPLAGSDALPGAGTSDTGSSGDTGTTDAGAAGSATGDTASPDPTSPTGTSAADTTAGDPTAQHVVGTAADDTLIGGAGVDVLEGGAGADRLDGGAGADTASYAASPAGVEIDLGAGVARGGDAAGDQLVDVEDLVGSPFADALTGTDGPNVLAGGAGEDVLAGGGGADVYRFAPGDGLDEVRDEAGVMVAETVTVAREESYTEVVWWNGGENSYYTEEPRTRTVYETETRWREERYDAGRDTVAFAAGIGPESLWLHREGADLVLTVAAPGADTAPATAVDAVRLRNWDAAATRVEQLRFDDGTVIDLEPLATVLGVERIRLAAVGDPAIAEPRIDTVSYERSGTPVDVSLAVADPAASGVLTGVERVIGSAYADRLEGDGLGNRLVGGAGDDTLTGGGAADVLDGGSGTDTVSYAESAAGVTVRLAAGTGAGGDAEGDTLLDVEQVTGSAFDDVLEGGPGANVLVGAAGDDVLAGGGGADRLDGGEGRDTVSYAQSPAGVVIDLATGVAKGGDAVGDGLVDVEDVEGSAFADALTGTAGPNVLTGGGGDDVLSGGGGDDVYRMARGGGWDTVRDERRVPVAETVTVAREETYTEVVWWNGGENSYYTEEVRTRTVYDTATRWREEVQDGGRDTLAFAAGIGPEALWVHREGADLVVAVAAPGAEGEPGAAVDGVRLRDWDTAATRVERLAFDDGAVIDLAALDGVFDGEPVNLALGEGISDVRVGSAGSDTYLFRRGDGQDEIVGSDAAPTSDRVVLGAGIDVEDVWLGRRGDDLDLTVAGVADRLTFRGWYGTPSARVDEIRTSDGAVLLEAQVEQLRQAMAAFDPPSSTELVVRPEVDEALAPVLAAAWQRPPA